jgi:hypothetical protein
MLLRMNLRRPVPPRGLAERLAPALPLRPGSGSSGAERPLRPRAAIAPETARRRLALAIAALLLLGFPLAVALALAATAPRPADVERRWRELAGFDPRVAFPSRTANASASRLEEALRPVGIELSPAGAERRPRYLPATAPWVAPVARQAHQTFTSLRAAHPRLQPAGSAGRATLEAARPTLLAARAALLAGEPPRWELDLGKGWLVETPDLRRHQLLHRLLLLAAHDAELAGASAETEVWLEAAWTLRSGLADDPLLASQRISLAELHDELALLRALRRPLPRWRERLTGLRVSPSVDRALRVEGWLAARGLGDYAAAVASDERWSRRAARAGSWLLARHGALHVVEATDHAIARARRDGARALHGRFLAEELSRVPRWSRIARNLLGHSLGMPLRAARSTLAVELTAQALALEELRARGGEPPPTQRSAVGGVTWVYERRPGRLMLRPSQELPVPGKHPLPLLLEVPWRDSAAASGTPVEDTKGSPAPADRAP